MNTKRAIFLRYSFLLLPLLQSCIENKLKVIPNPPSALSLVNPLTSPGTQKQPIIKVEGVYPSQTVKLFSDPNCQNLVGSNVSKSTELNIKTTPLAAGDNNIFANVTNPDGTE
jgi:hypothetical protein